MIKRSDCVTKIPSNPCDGILSARLITQKKHRVPFNNAPVPLLSHPFCYRNLDGSLQPSNLLLSSDHPLHCLLFSQIEILARKDFLLFISLHSRLDVRRSYTYMLRAQRYVKFRAHFELYGDQMMRMCLQQHCPVPLSVLHSPSSL